MNNVFKMYDTSSANKVQISQDWLGRGYTLHTDSHTSKGRGMKNSGYFVN